MQVPARMPLIIAWGSFLSIVLPYLSTPPPVSSSPKQTFCSLSSPCALAFSASQCKQFLNIVPPCIQ